MKFSYSWIRSLVDGLDMPAEALEKLITMKTAECEGVETSGALLEGAVAATVETVEPIEGSHNVKAVIDAGRYGHKTVVCGAPNCRAGLRTVYVPLGKKVVSGIESDGMLASAAELGINRDNAGIVELRGAQELPFPDKVIDIDNKSITHRPDLWGHHGMAREVAAITGKTLRDPVSLDSLPPAAGGSPIAVKSEDQNLCPRFSALVFENVTVQPSPLWLQARLTAVGLNPINNIVDLTNFLMAELAQPTHAYDRAKLAGETLTARPAREAERIVALNDEEYVLTPSNLVIADAAGPVGIAGVIGGRDTAISSSTTSIVLEAANFNASSVRKTSASLKLRTDASMRFEKAQDPHNTVRALARAIDLLPMLSPGARLVGGLADSCAKLSDPAPIPLNLDWLARKLGRVLDAAEVRRILESLQFRVDEKFMVTAPSWRATKDVAMPEDLVEEVGRMIGYDSIERQPPLVPCAPSFDPPAREFLRRLKRLLSARGFTEVSNYSFISEQEALRFGLEIETHVRVLNPIAAGQELLRTSLLPGIHRNIVENAKHFDEFRIFEIGHEIHAVDGKPVENPHLMAAVFSRDDGAAALLELKRAAESLAPAVHVGEAVPRIGEHPARCVTLCSNGREFGRMSEMHPTLTENGRAAVLDIDLEVLEELNAAPASYKPVRKFPTSDFDLSIIAGARERAGTLEAEIRRFAGGLAETVEYVREYQGERVPPGRKSVSFRIVAGAPDHTLQPDEITDLRNRIIAGLTGLGYELRV
ncbi:MAG: phenylalanine--tRNA ligase subunit beta [Acidobacteriota bacterium]|nr:phenylalanine--tRNA ligase subunit beta [Acidobacteriota bacterium]